MLAADLVEGHALNPFNGRPLVGREAWRVHIPVLGQVHHAHITQIEHKLFSSFLFYRILTPRVTHRVKNNLVDQLLNGRLVVGKVDLAGPLLAHMAGLYAADRDGLEQRIMQRGGVGGEIGERRRRVRANDNAILETRGIDDIDAGEDRAHGLRQGLDQAKVLIRAPGVNHSHARGSQVGTHGLEKLARRQLERHVWLLIGIDGDLVVFLLRRLQIIAPILHDYMQIWLVHMEILAGEVDNLAIQLNAIDGNGAAGYWDHKSSESPRPH